jgi:hypothetical protein
MHRLRILAGHLLALAALPAGAQTPTAPACESVVCPRPAGRSLARAGLLRGPARDARRDADRDWKNNMTRRDDQENFDCLLSFVIGGDLQSGGYKGLRLLGKTRTLSSSEEKGAP